MQLLGKQALFVVKFALLKHSLLNLLNYQFGNGIELLRGLTTERFANNFVLLSRPERTLLTAPMMAADSPLSDVIGHHIHSIGLALRWFRFSRATSRHHVALTSPWMFAARHTSALSAAKISGQFPAPSHAKDD